MSAPPLDLATYPSQDLLRVLAALLQQIARTNDRLRPPPASSSTQPHAMPNGPAPRTDPPESGLDRISGVPHMTSAAQGALTTVGSDLCFHARHVPSISIADYLMRILKYCPTTNEVFLSVIIYLDRMSRMGGATLSPARAQAAAFDPEAPTKPVTADGLTRALDPAAPAAVPPSTAHDAPTERQHAYPGMKGFAIDSYNVHRLVIAAVTVASKFFSDVFYTNSRYAKVGGLPVAELNSLELQFLLLNDFNLFIPLDEFQRYADQLIAFGSGGRYAAAAAPPRSLPPPQPRPRPVHTPPADPIPSTDAPRPP